MAWVAVSALAHGAEAPQASPPPPCEVRSLRELPLHYDGVRVLPDGRITFRLCAPSAHEVAVVSFEVPGVPSGLDGKPAGLPMTLDAGGYWSAETAVAAPPGHYAYGFRVDGVSMPDPMATDFAREQRGVRSTFSVRTPDNAWETFQPQVPHGLVAQIRYLSGTLGIERRAHVYLPPGYERGGTRRYPVLYLVHGAFDSDAAWIAKGRANDILDNLIASGEATPMIIVMPDGHTPDRPGLERLANDDFAADLLQDLIPYVDAHFRTQARAASRAMAGLSMGGAHTLYAGLPRPEVFGAIGVFSIALLTEAEIARYRARFDPGLRARARANSTFLLAMGREDGIHGLLGGTRRMLDDYGIGHQYLETGGGHDWRNWRDYLRALAPQLFRPGSR